MMTFEQNMAIQAQAAAESTIARLTARVAELEAERDMLAQELAVVEAVLERAAIRVPEPVDLEAQSPEEQRKIVERLIAAGIDISFLGARDNPLDADDTDTGC